MNAERLMALAGVTAFVLTIWWVRSRVLREKFALLWVLAATLVLLAGLFPEVLKSTAALVKLSYPALVLFIVLGVLYVSGVAVSMILTRLHQRVTRLTQELALLRCKVSALGQRIQQLEEQNPHAADGVRSAPTRDRAA
jgi:hypothetical protein